MWIAEGEGIVFVSGKGKRRPQIQQLYDELEECGNRLMEYKNCFEIMGKDRNSYVSNDRTVSFFHIRGKIAITR